MYKRTLQHYAFLFAILVLSVGGLSAAPPKDTALHVHTGEKVPRGKELRLRMLNNRALETYRQQPAFQYDDKHVGKGQNWWSRFWRWFWQWLGRLFGEREGETSTASPFGTYAVIVALVAAIIYFVIKYMHLENIFRKKPETPVVPYSEALKNIHEISFDKQIAEAVERKNFKIAVRLQYLSALKGLSDAGLIAWQPDKPNSVYLQELRERKYRDPFEQLTRQFEYVWYGDFPLGEQAFGNINRLFTDFKRMLP